MSVQLSTLTARGIDNAPSVVLSFGRPEDGIAPEDIWSGRLEVWRKLRDYPKRGEVDAVLAFLDHSGLGANDPIPDYEDGNLVPGEEYYYTVYAEDTNGDWHFGGSFSQVHTFPWPSAFDHTEYIYTRWIDGEVQKQDAKNDLTLRRLIQVLIGEPADSYKTYAEKLGTLNSLDNIPGSLLIEKDQAVGWPTASHRSFTFQREESRNLPELMKTKGTLTAIESAMVNISDYDVNLVNGSRFQFFANFSPTIFDSPAVLPNIDLATDVVKYLPDEDKWQRANAFAAFLEPIPDVSQGIDELFYTDLVRLFGSHNRDSTGESQLLPSNLDLFVSVTNWGTLKNIVLAPVPPVQNSAVLLAENFDSYTVGNINGKGPWAAPAANPDPLQVVTTQARSGTKSLGASLAAGVDAQDAKITSGIIGRRYYVLETYLYIPSGQTEELALTGFTWGTILMSPLAGQPIDSAFVTPDRIIWALDFASFIATGDLGNQFTFFLSSDYDTWIYFRMDYDTKLGVKNCYLRNSDIPQYTNVNAQKNFLFGGASPWTEGVDSQFVLGVESGAAESFEMYYDDITITGVD